MCGTLAVSGPDQKPWKSHGSGLVEESVQVVSCASELQETVDLERALVPAGATGGGWVWQVSHSMDKFLLSISTAASLQRGFGG